MNTQADDIKLEDRSEYELVMIAGREARRLNELARLRNRKIKGRVTFLAWDRLQTGRILFTYDEVPTDEQYTAPEIVDEMQETEFNEADLGAVVPEAPALDEGV